MNRIYLSLLVSILLSSCFLEKENCDKMTKITSKDTIYSMEWQCGNPLINGVSFRDFKK